MGKVAKVMLFGSLVVFVSITGLQAIGSSVEAEFAAQNAGATVSKTDVSSAEVPSPSLASTAAPIQRAGSTILEQAIFDAFPPTPPKTKAERRKAANAADFVGAAINAAGHLCARPIEAQEAAPGQYGVGCLTRRDGSGRSNYLIDSRTGSVDEI